MLPKSEKIDIKRILISLATSVAVAASAVLICTAVLMMTGDPDSLVGEAAPAALLISALVSGLISSKQNKGSVLSVGIAGACFTLALTLLSFIFFKTNISLGESILLHVGVIVLFLLGGIIGKRKNLSRKKYRRRKKIR